MNFINNSIVKHWMKITNLYFGVQQKKKKKPSCLTGSCFGSSRSGALSICLDILSDLGYHYLCSRPEFNVLFQKFTIQ